MRPKDGNGDVLKFSEFRKDELILQAQAGIDIGSIEKELTALWKDLGDEEGGVIRSCVLNLIVFALGDKSQPALDEAIIEITEKHPSRAIVLLADPANTNASLEAWVTSRCSLSHALSKQVCCEQISVHAAGSSLKESPSAVASLILADLPVYLWTRDALRLDDALFKKIAELADRILVDSSAPGGPQLGDIASYVQSSARHTPLMDLNWSRLITWRALAADFYDVDDYRSHLQAINRVQIKHLGNGNAEHRGIAPRALYLAGWLASRLGWKPIERVQSKDEQLTSFMFDSGGGRTVRIELDDVSERAGTTGHIEELTLSAEDGSIFSVRKSEDRSRLSAEANFQGQRKCARVLGYDQWTEAELLSRELEALGRDRVFEKSAALAHALSTLI